MEGDVNTGNRSFRVKQRALGVAGGYVFFVVERHFTKL
jgi:hypothetical protein